MGYNWAKLKMSEQQLCCWCRLRPVVYKPWVLSSRGFCSPKCEAEYAIAHPEYGAPTWK